MTTDETVAYFPFQYPVNVKPFRLWDTKNNCVLVLSQSHQLVTGSDVNENQTHSSKSQ